MQRVKVTLEPSVQSIVFTKINSSTTISFQLQFAANTTTMLATPLTTSMIESALNSLPSIASVGSVQVRLQDTSETHSQSCTSCTFIINSYICSRSCSSAWYRIMTHIFELCWRLSHNQWSTSVLNSLFSRGIVARPNRSRMFQRVSTTVRPSTLLSSEYPAGRLARYDAQTYHP